MLRRHLVPAVLVALTIPMFLAMPGAHAVPSALVVAEVYGGGGNSGAALTRDFIELGNADAFARDLTGWSVQYLPGSRRPPACGR